MADLSKIFKALGDNTRLRILNLLLAKPLCVCEINSILPFSQSTISGHLKVLKDVQLVVDRKDGLWVDYLINQNHPRLADLIGFIEQVISGEKSFQKEREKALIADRMKIIKN